MKKKDKKGFTLAEVLITLSIIGVIAAILFPSILANYNERTLKAKRQALVGRMSQAMGEMSDTFRNYEDATCNESNVCTDIASAAKFINEGLGKVYKIAAVCDNDSLSACDFPTTVTLLDGSKFSFDKSDTITHYNNQLYSDGNTLQMDTKSAAFMTKNGESILLFYNPRCEGKPHDNQSFYTESKFCVNMVYDLNGGKKKPNKMGEDIGFMTVSFSDEPTLAAPKIINPDNFVEFETTLTDASVEQYINRKSYTFAQAKTFCSGFGENVTLPTLDEAMAMQINSPLMRDRIKQKTKTVTWTNTYCSPGAIYASRIPNYVEDGKGDPNHGGNAWHENGQILETYCIDPARTEYNASAKLVARCVERD